MLARSPEQKGKLIVKRVVATAGSTLHVPPADDSGLGVHIESVVDIPEDHVWLSGDNMPSSQDSRSYGPVPTRNLMGRLVVAVCPLRPSFLPIFPLFQNFLMVLVASLSWKIRGSALQRGSDMACMHSLACRQLNKLGAKK